jgi:hypothetical protein
MQDQPPDHRGQFGPRAINEFSRLLTKKPLGLRGFTETALIAEWSVIVGEAQSLGSLPVKITFPAGDRSNGTLHVRVVSGGLAMEFNHREPLILQRINGYFGYGAVARLKITQGPVPPRLPKKNQSGPPILPPEEERSLQDKLALIDDPELRDALARLGRRLSEGNR